MSSVFLLILVTEPQIIAMKRAYVKVTVWEAANKNSLALYTLVFPQEPQQLNHIKFKRMYQNPTQWWPTELP